MIRNRLAFALVCLGALLAGITATTWGQPAAQAAPTAPSYDPNQLSYGLYWFGVNGDSQKFAPGGPNPYFNSARPTLIFVHGWQPFLSNSLPNFNFDGVDTAAGWIAAGWNVGIFVWNQFSDETTGATAGAWFGDGPPPQGVLDAEAKVWSVNGPKGMRWRDWDKPLLLPPDYGYSAPPAGTPSAGELFYQTYIAALPATYTQTIRIAGHSLGNQMAVRLAHLVSEGIAAGAVSENLRPTRVALLDPYWSPGSRDDIPDGDAAGRKTGDVIRETIAALIPSGVLFEWYWSSAWTTPPQGDANDALKPMVFYAAMNPAFETEEVDKHLAAQHLYFWSHTFDGPGACTGEACLGMDRVLSRMTDAQLAAVLRSDYRWEQIAGQNTDTPDDDVYQSLQQSDAPYTVTQLVANPIIQTVGNVVTVTAVVSAPDGALVTFAASLGKITPRAVVSNGLTIARLTSDMTGTAHISATTRGVGGDVQETAIVTFTAPAPECIPLTGAAIAGPTSGITGTAYVFTATVVPLGATRPITYTWTPTPLLGNLLLSGQSVATYTWSVAGDYVIDVMAENCAVSSTATHTIHIAGALYRIYLPLVLRQT